MSEEHDGGGNEKGVEENSLQRVSIGEQGSLQFQLVQKGDGEKVFMEAEGRGLSDLLRNSTEEMLLKSLMDSSMGLTAPSMEMLGLKKISQTLRADSEELFNSWLMNGEVS